MDYRIAHKVGRLRCGYERDSGSIYHAVPTDKFFAVCGTKPGMDWSTNEGEKVTCPRCIRKLAKLAEAA